MDIPYEMVDSFLDCFAENYQQLAQMIYNYMQLSADEQSLPAVMKLILHQAAFAYDLSIIEPYANQAFGDNMAYITDMADKNWFSNLLIQYTKPEASDIIEYLERMFNDDSEQEVIDGQSCFESDLF